MNDLEQREDLTHFLALVRYHLKLVDEDLELAMDTDLDGMGLDSISALNLMLDLEEAFGIVFQNSMFTEEIFATPYALWKALSTLRKR